MTKITTRDIPYLHSNLLVIKKNQSASVEAITLDFDPNGTGGNVMKINGTFAIAGPAGPASSTGGGNTGQFAFDNDYLYLCTSGGQDGSATWKRVPLNAF
jgi:hypothetical protein